MSEDDNRFSDIRAFYARLQQTMPSGRGLPPHLRGQSGNVCGSCFECCKYHIMMSKYEFDFLEDYLIRTRGHNPLQWVTCTTPLQDKRLSQPVDPDAHCPLFQKGVGCTAYEARPLTCRTFGPLRPYTTPLPSTCVFTESQPYSKTEEIPLWQEYADMLRRHQPSPPGYFVARGQAPAGAVAPPDES